MARYLLIGALGGPNFGDELILLSWIKTIRQKDAKAEIFCDGYDLNNLKLTVEGIAEVVHQHESFWCLCEKFIRYPECDILSDISRHSKENSDSLLEGLYALSEKNIDQIHIIGGGYFNELWPNNYLILVMCCLLSWLNNSRLVATGLGLEPTHIRDISGLRVIFRSFDLLDVRDEGSYNLMQDLENVTITYSGDDALLVFADRTNNNFVYEIKESSVVICLQNDLFNGESISYDIFTDDFFELLLDYKIKKIIFAKAMVDDVSECSDEFKDKLKKENIEFLTINPQELIANGFPLSHGGVVITSRYHPHFLAALSGEKGVALTSQPYYDIKHKAVHDMGSNWPLLNLNRFNHDFHREFKKVLDSESPNFRMAIREAYIKRKNEVAEYVLKVNYKKNKHNVEILKIWFNIIDGSNNLDKTKILNKETF